MTTTKRPQKRVEPEEFERWPSEQDVKPPELPGLQLQELHEGAPGLGYGYFDEITGRMIYYSDGLSSYFFSAETGRPALYIEHEKAFFL